MTPLSERKQQILRARIAAKTAIAFDDNQQSGREANKKHSGQNLLRHQAKTFGRAMRRRNKMI